jgi:hypothetical protein
MSSSFSPLEADRLEINRVDIDPHKQWQVGSSRPAIAIVALFEWR